LILLGGEAGAGKTRLLAETAQRAGNAGMLVLAGGCYKQEGRLAYGPIHDALLDYVRAQPDQALRTALGDLPDLVRILPEVRNRLSEMPEEIAGDPESQRLRLFSAVALLLERIATAYERSGDLEALLRVTARIGSLHVNQGTPEEGLTSVQGVLDRIGSSSPSPGLVRLYASLGSLLFVLGHNAEQLEAAERAVGVAETLGDNRTLGVAKAEHGLALLGM
jgi:hypothetical protein